MKKIILLATILAVFVGCKKTSDEVNTDTTNRVFRIAANSDKNFTLYILEYKVVDSKTDTIKYASFGGNLDVNQGFTPAIGNKVNIRAVTATGSFLNVNLVYKGASIGPGANVTTNEGITSDFTYDIKN